VTFDTHLPLNERLLRIDHIQARRYSKLGGIALEIATEGIVRHLKACDRMDEILRRQLFVRLLMMR